MASPSLSGRFPRVLRASTPPGVSPAGPQVPGASRISDQPPSDRPPLSLGAPEFQVPAESPINRWSAIESCPAGDPKLVWGGQIEPFRLRPNVPMANLPDRFGRDYSGTSVAANAPPSRSHNRVPYSSRSSGGVRYRTAMPAGSTLPERARSGRRLAASPRRSCTPPRRRNRRREALSGLPPRRHGIAALATSWTETAWNADAASAG